MDEQKRAYQALLRGFKQYKRDTVDRFTDKTYIGIVRGFDPIEEEYTVELNGVLYPHVSTIGGNCYINETVHILIPQGNFTNMIIMKSDSTSGIVSGVSSVNSKVGAVVLTAEDVNAVEINDIEDTDIDFSNYFE